MAGDDTVNGGLKIGRRTKDEAEKTPAIWFAGAWRSPAGVERARERLRLRQQQRRKEGTGR